MSRDNLFFINILDLFLNILCIIYQIIIICPRIRSQRPQIHSQRSRICHGLSTHEAKHQAIMHRLRRPLQSTVVLPNYVRPIPLLCIFLPFRPLPLPDSSIHLSRSQEMQCCECPACRQVPEQWQTA